MVGRIYNIAKLVSQDHGIYFEGDALLNVNALNIKNYEPTKDPIAIAKLRNDIYLKATDQAVIRLRFTLTYPGYPKDDFICYSIFNIIKVKIRDYRQILKDLHYLKFMKMKRGIRNLLVEVMQNFDYVVTDMPYLINANRHPVYDVSNFEWYLSEFYPQQTLDYNKDIQIDKSIYDRRGLVLLLYDRYLAFDIARSLPNAMPVTLVNYPIRVYAEGLDKSRRLESEL